MKKSLMIMAFLMNGVVQAAPLAVDQKASQVHFEAVGRPAMLKIKGESPGPEANLSLEGNSVSGSLSLDLNQLDTGIALRNEHMKEKYLQVNQYPKAKLTITKLQLPANFKISDGLKKQEFQGQLELHGVTKDVFGEFSLENKSLTAQFDLKISDYKIEIPSYMGITVADSVKTTVVLKFQ